MIMVINVSQPFPSTIESVYVPAHKPEIVEEDPLLVAPVLQLCVKGAVPPLKIFTVIEPSHAPPQLTF